MKFIRDNELSYWDNYYTNKEDQEANIPSQFAVFALSEMNDSDISCIIECGVGNGRDSIFFSRHDKNVISLDRSLEAIEILSKKVSGNQNIKLLQHDVKSPFPKAVSDCEGNKAIYARFFLHSLDKISLEMFFKHTSKIMENLDILFVEYRNENDKTLPKVTGTHFREYYSSSYISEIAEQNELMTCYQVSGTGYAKFKHDDAFVTRQIFKKKF
jgi:hypothetical protein